MNKQAGTKLSPMAASGASVGPAPYDDEDEYPYLRAAGTANINLIGWNASVEGNLNPWLGLVGEFTGTYDSRASGANFDVYTFLAGPRISYRKEERTRPFAHVLFGAAHANAGFGGSTSAETTFTTAVGGGIDFKVTDRVAIRAGQLDWLLTKFGNDTQSNFRFSAGITIRIGKK